MTEWGVVGVIVALVGLGAAIIKPVLALNTSITRLNLTLEQLQRDVGTMTTKNSKSHERIWDRLGEHDDALEAHERRIDSLEHRE